jgi:cytochrome c oxidase assembly protein subunit 15
MTSARPNVGLGPALVIGFGTTVALWVGAFVLHLPGIRLVPAAVTGPLLLAVWCVATVVLARDVPRGRSPVVGAVAGLITSLLCLLVLGALLVEQPEGDQPARGFKGVTRDAVISAVGFLITGGIAGAVFTFLGSRWGRPERQAAGVDWLARFALATAIAIVPLLLVGGAVTTTDSGMAIQGWPDSYGANMFLYPISLMSSPARFLEHTHRLFGSLVGLTTLALMVYVLAADKRRWVKVTAVVLFAAVCVQGWVGGQRVLENSRWLAMAHGVAAQLVFGLAVALAACVSPTFREPGLVTRALHDRRMRFFTTGLLHSTILQLIFGAMYRHLRSPHALWTHVGFSLVVVGFAMMAGLMLTARHHAHPPHPPHPAPAQSPALTRTLTATGWALVAAVALQFALGWTAFMMTAEDREASSTAEALVRTAHQANGALVLALATLGFTWTRRVLRAVRAANA